MTYKTPDDVIEQAEAAIEKIDSWGDLNDCIIPGDDEIVAAVAPIIARAALRAARKKLEAEVAAVGGDPGMSSWDGWRSGVERGIDILDEMIGDDDE